MQSQIIRNKLAGMLAIASGVLFLASGYHPSTAIYDLVAAGLKEYTAKDVWQVAIVPLGLLALVAQLGGIVVIIGGVLFFKNRITTGKFFVMIGTGQGILTIILSLILGLASEGSGFLGNYVLWFTGTAAGIGIICSIISRTIAIAPVKAGQRR
ncbi:hypothetical protein NTE_00758 [Candidatus Nitrososphaera evergladensis SR1]|jgi:hypothetical protein|uniref:Uncharacterized protein n=1 Tax=Candidatus Nitrososphaera evergladensis SR1 TaxID=1459636 RepID=A0A075MMZ1_9ARCH|nr:hypothetical protein [Candidatus Nitrososphaera evergladensis]AIF82836.1 hypothetical protein NTE_00758 [Candidatus Nitrososphaera evergladensis SR1]